MNHRQEIRADLLVIGNGMAGMAAAIFALNRGLTVVLAGCGSPISLASGCLDLLACHPISEGKTWDDPWAAIEALRRDHPRHPYARLSRVAIEMAWDELLCFLQKVGLPYSRFPDQNVEIPTPTGATRKTYGLPKTMWPGVQALTEGKSCLILDFEGLKGFSAPWVVQALRAEGKNVRSARIAFPGLEGRRDLLPEHLAQALMTGQNLQKLAQKIYPFLSGIEVIGLPAVLGLYRAEETVDALAKHLGLSVFEIPTLPPSVPGLRLQEALERGLMDRKGFILLRHRLTEVEALPGRGFRITIPGDQEAGKVMAQGILLAGGRFGGGGLQSDRKTLREPLFHLPVHQPESREQWHRPNLFDPKGHAINRAGLEIDEHFRPLNRRKEPAFETLFAAGSILAHQDWKREKSGTGLALATAYAAVEAFRHLRKS